MEEIWLSKSLPIFFLTTKKKKRGDILQRWGTDCRSRVWKLRFWFCHWRHHWTEKPRSTPCLGFLSLSLWLNWRFKFWQFGGRNRGKAKVFSVLTPSTHRFWNLLIYFYYYYFIHLMLCMSALTFSEKLFIFQRAFSRKLSYFPVFDNDLENEFENVYWCLVCNF